MFRLFFIFLFLFFPLFSYADNPSTSQPPKDVNVLNTPNVKIQGKVQVEIDEFTDVVSAPVLEEPDSFLHALNPLIIWQSTVKSFTLNEQVGECPISRMILFKRNITLDSHCKVFSDVSPFLNTACMFFYLSLSLLIVLRA